jgi:hypothetical protein
VFPVEIVNGHDVNLIIITYFTQRSVEKENKKYILILDKNYIEFFKLVIKK